MVLLLVVLRGVRQRQRRSDLVVLLVLLIVVVAEFGQCVGRFGAHWRHLLMLPWLVLLLLLALELALGGLLPLLLLLGLLRVWAAALDSTVAVLVDTGEYRHKLEVFLGKGPVIEITVLNELNVIGDFFGVLPVNVLLNKQVTMVSIMYKVLPYTRNGRSTQCLTFMLPIVLKDFGQL